MAVTVHEDKLVGFPPRIPLLDKGYVELQDYMGNDDSIVSAARTSYLGDSKGDAKDKKLLRFLLENNHTTPFEMVKFRFRVKVPLFIARQWMRHRTGSFTEVSRRYTTSDIDFYFPDSWNTQAKNNKQCSGDKLELTCSQEVSELFEKQVSSSYQTYLTMIESGVSREQARMILPQNMYTTFVWSVDAHNLMHFMKLRMDSHAQYEIRVYAEAIYDGYFKLVLPWTSQAFNDFVLCET
jgi:thymidylate synthase (FAD)